MKTIVRNRPEEGKDFDKAQEKASWMDRHHLGFLNLILYCFLPHSEGELESVSNQRRAAIDGIDGLWPRPWIFSRALLLFAVSFGLLYVCWTAEGRGIDSTLLPGMITVGALAVPLSMLIFFFECNKFRSIPLLTVLRFFLVGSCVSIAITFVLTFAFDMGVETRVSVPREMRQSLGLWFSTVRPLYWVDSHPAIPIAFAALFEEFSKTLIIFFFLMHYRTRNYILQGLLVGAAVGAGFSVFESAGYALVGNDNLLGSIVTRGIMSPASHTAWGALIGGGTMLIVKGRLRYSLLFNPKFSLLFFFVSVLHFAWNYLLDTSDSLTGNLQLAVFTWFVLLMLLWFGVLQIRRFKQQGYLPVEL